MVVCKTICRRPERKKLFHNVQLIKGSHNRNVFHTIVYRRNCYFMAIFMTSMNFIDVLIPSPKYLFFRQPEIRQIFSSRNGYYLLKQKNGLKISLTKKSQWEDFARRKTNIFFLTVVFLSISNNNSF